MKAETWLLMSGTVLFVQWCVAEWWWRREIANQLAYAAELAVIRGEGVSAIELTAARAGLSVAVESRRAKIRPGGV